MTTLRQQLQSYAAYHHDPRNKATHFFGVPLVTFSLFLALSWFRLRFATDLPITAATLFYLVVFLYYLRLDWSIALLQFPFSLALLLLADRVAPGRRARRSRCSPLRSWVDGSFSLSATPSRGNGRPSFTICFRFSTPRSF